MLEMLSNKKWKQASTYVTSKTRFYKLPVASQGDEKYRNKFSKKSKKETFQKDQNFKKPEHSWKVKNLRI